MDNNDLDAWQRVDELINSQDTNHVNMSVDVYFLSDSYWENEVLYMLETYHYDRKYRNYIRNKARAIEYQGVIYVKGSARQDRDFLRMILHELGHAVCNFNHVDREGDIMNSDYRKWYGDWGLF